MKLSLGARVTHPTFGEGTIRTLRRGGRVAVVRFEGSPLAQEVASAELRVNGHEDDRDRVDESEHVDEPIDESAVENEHVDEPIGENGREREGEREDEHEPEHRSDRPSLVPSMESGRAALTLEAMRLGVVPLADLDAYTVGRDDELTVVEADLEKAARKGAVRAFLGDYGVGKTHLLELLQQRALESGFLTALVMLDPTETPPSQPKRVYRALMRSLRYPDRPFEEAVGLRPLLDKAVGSPEALALLGLDPSAPGETIDERLNAGFHLYLSPALAYLRALSAPNTSGRQGRKKRVKGSEGSAAEREQSIELLLDWLEGHPTISNQDIDARLARLAGRYPKIYSLIDYRPWSRIYGYLLSGIAALACAVGYRGLLVTLDEAEFYALLSRQNRFFASHLFRCWSYAAVGGAAGPELTEPLPFDSKDIEMGGYGIQQRLPGRYSSTPGLYVVYAMTPNPDGVTALEGALPADNLHALTPLEHDHYLELASKICDFYASAHPEWALSEQLVDPLGKVLSGLIHSGIVESPRQAMKFLIEFLDVVRYEPSSVGALIRGLQTQLDW